MALDNPRSQVAHLLRRAGFGATEAELDQYTPLGFAGALDRILNPEQVDDSATDQLLAPLTTDLGDPKKIEAAKFWWFNRMLYTQRPLQEKMTLFWHNHFATANSKVNNSVLMQQQIQLFRDNGLGNFETLLQKVTRDPATLIWLDNRLNRKGATNENFAREVQELFTVGIGNYTEQDIKEAARAFTGHTLDKNAKYIFNKNQHDAGVKTFQGQTGNFDADDILAILVRNPATARFITTKLFTYFVYDNPDPSTIDRLAGTFVSSNFDMRSVMRDLFGGPEFLSPQAFHGQIKQPVELVAGSLKALNVQNVGPDVTQFLRRMGQDLLNPPDVSGWKGGSAWINATTLFERFNWGNRLAMGRDATKPYFADVPAQLQWHNLSSPEGSVDYYLGLLVDGDVTPEARQALVDYINASGPLALDNGAALDLQARGMVHLALATPTFQLA
ncbi:MAG TPA: DUF1800 domain-containing protein [Chloroflexota bacterium]|nr:DUF1800 domain-containing protein [Chloroflexota bacterium]